MNHNIKKALILGAVVALAGMQTGFAMQEEETVVLEKKLLMTEEPKPTQDNVAIAKKLAPLAKSMFTKSSQEEAENCYDLDDCLKIMKTDDKIATVRSAKYNLLITYSFAGNKCAITSIKKNSNEECLEQPIFLDIDIQDIDLTNIQNIANIANITNAFTSMINGFVKVLVYSDRKSIETKEFTITKQPNGIIKACSKTHGLFVTYQLNGHSQASVISIKDEFGIEYINQYYACLKVKQVVQKATYVQQSNLEDQMLQQALHNSLQEK